MAISSNSIDTSVYSCPFTTRIIPGDGVLFSLWAPMAGQAALCLDQHTGNTDVIRMQPQPDGWFTLLHHRARPGDQYQYLIDGDLKVPDPGSRYQAADVHGPSVICDPLAFIWKDHSWRGRPWEDVVMYELHIGAFSAEGTFEGVRRRLDYLKDLGITAIELMPVAHFAGCRNWGYDGALLFAPCNCYGTPEDFKNLVQDAHRLGLMVFLDVVFNHFGPEGNYLHVYAGEAFFAEEHQTPWGAAIRYAGRHSRYVRDFFIANALYWLEEYHLDGLRIDAAHTIIDPSQPDILEEIALAIRHGPGHRRNIHLIIENDNNRTRYLERTEHGAPRLYTAQWNDDLHHALHVLLTDETEGYYVDYQPAPIDHLARCLSEGFSYQGDASPFRGNLLRGDPSTHLPPLSFVSFLQNHDQIGNRAFGERLSSLCGQDELCLCTALLALAPSPPLFFMGEEFGATTPFYYFCDYGPELAERVTSGRRAEFSAFREFTDPESRSRIPDPNAISTFLASKLDWSGRLARRGQEYLEFVKRLLQLRHREIVPRLHAISACRCGSQVLGNKALHAWWQLGDGSLLSVWLNLHHHAIGRHSPPTVERLVFWLSKGNRPYPAEEQLPPLTIVWTLRDEGGEDG